MVHIMIAFVSPVSKQFLHNPVNYPDIQGKPYGSIQTNESAIIYIERMLKQESLSRIFLIASDFVKSNLVPEENEFGEVTHLQFLQRRILKECPQLEGKFSIQNYTDKLTEPERLNTNILQTAEIADAITEYAKECRGSKIKVHADMTGGFRHTSMMMLSIMQLLKYRGIEIGEVLYSDPNIPVVYKANEIQHMFTLITGADEFVKFGSVKALEEYFGKNPPDVMAELLKAMRKFSEAIKICRTSEIEVALKNLGTQIKTFRENPDKGLKSELFAKIIDTIESEYGNLISDKGNRLDIIRWCIDKEFWQQAMTLCTEWLPEEIVDRGICKPKNAIVAKDAEVDGISFGRGWKQHLIIAYQGDNNIDAQKERYINQFCNELRQLIYNVLNPFTEMNISEAKHGNLKKLSKEYKEALYDFRKCQNGKIDIETFKSSYPMIFQTIESTYDVVGKAKTPAKKANALKTVNYDKLLNKVAALPNDELLKFLNISKNDAIAQTLQDKNDTAAQSNRKWKNREDMYRKMWRTGILTSDIDKEIAIDLLHDYYDIRTERNQINHANSRSAIGSDQLKGMIENYLNKLERYSRRLKK